jgi:hypothetical protein
MKLDLRSATRPNVRRKPLGREVWAKVDWRLPDAELARRLGVTREAVRQARKRMGKEGASPSLTARFRAYAVAHRAELQGLKVAEALKCAGVELRWLSGWRVLDAAGITAADAGRPSRLSRLSDADWRLPDSVLGKIWRISQDRVADRRRLLGRPPANWDARRAGVSENPAYRAALAREKQKAAKAHAPAAP